MRLTWVLAAALLVSSSAWATNFSTTHRYNVMFHYTSIAYGKKVQSISVVSGVEMQPAQGGAPYLADVQTTVLDRVGDHFVGKRVIHAEGGLHVDNPIRPVVYYRARFEDGSESDVTHAYEIPTFLYAMQEFDGSKDQRSIEDAVHHLDSEEITGTDADATWGVELRVRTVD